MPLDIERVSRRVARRRVYAPAPGNSAIAHIRVCVCCKLNTIESFVATCVLPAKAMALKCVGCKPNSVIAFWFICINKHVYFGQSFSSFLSHIVCILPNNDSYPHTHARRDVSSYFRCTSRQTSAHRASISSTRGMRSITFTTSSTDRWR